MGKGRSELAGEFEKQVVAIVGQQRGAGKSMKSYQLWWQLLLEVFRQVAGGEHGTSAAQQCYHSQARAGQGLRVSPSPFYHYAHLWTYSGRTGEEKVWLPIAITLYLYLDKIQRVNKEELGSDRKNFNYWNIVSLLNTVIPNFLPTENLWSVIQKVPQFIFTKCIRKSI